VIYIFHANTDGLDMLQQSAGAALKQGATFRAKVRERRRKRALPRNSRSTDSPSRSDGCAPPQLAPTATTALKGTPLAPQPASKNGRNDSLWRVPLPTLLLQLLDRPS
jgi:hypothetical protein